ncbi:MAG: TatD family hydrolase [Candidatus Ozemobacteraceae bacterium]
MNLALIDVHAHLQDDAYQADRETVVARCREAGMTAVINAGTDLENSRHALKLAENEPIFWALAGFHPHEAKHWTDSAAPIAELENLLNHPKVLGVGEIGLDYHYDFSPHDVQQQVFIAQWDLAARHSLPAVVHIREAFDDFWNLIANRPAPPQVLLHCFSGNMEQARLALDHGFHFSIGGPLTFPKSEETRLIFKFLPADLIHLETDCPYLSPVPFRGKRNEPANVIHAFRKLCEIRQAEPGELATTLSSNAQRLFAPRLIFASLT